MRRSLALLVAGISLAIAGCGGEQADARLTRPCDVTSPRVHGSFQGALGSQFGGLAVSTTGARSCQVRGGWPEVLVYVGGAPIKLDQIHHDRSAPPRAITVPVAPTDDGPGLRFEWLETCRPSGPISVRVRFPGTATPVRVVHEDHTVGPRCTAGSGVRPAVAVSRLGPSLSRLAI